MPHWEVRDLKTVRHREYGDVYRFMALFVARWNAATLSEDCNCLCRASPYSKQELHVWSPLKVRTSVL